MKLVLFALLTLQLIVAPLCGADTMCMGEGGAHSAAMTMDLHHEGANSAGEHLDYQSGDCDMCGGGDLQGVLGQDVALACQDGFSTGVFSSGTNVVHTSETFRVQQPGAPPRAALISIPHVAAFEAATVWQATRRIRL